MPVHKVLVNEYECTRCGYRWINRVNGKEGQRPRRCGRCKRWDWDEGPMGDEEKKLRRRLIGLESEIVRTASTSRPGRRPNNMCRIFLHKIKPRPSVKELQIVLAQPNRSNRQDLMKEIIELRINSRQDQ